VSLGPESTRPEVRPLEKGQEGAYEAFVAGHEESNLYHRLAWRDLLCAVFRHSADYLVAWRAGRICGVLPLFRVRVPGLPFLATKLLSLPYDIGSGGPLADGEASARALVEFAVSRGRASRVSYPELRVTRPIPWLETLGFVPSRPALTSEMVLGDTEAVWSQVSKDHRKAMGKARRRGVEVREGTGLEDFERFYDVYSRAFRAFGTPPYPVRYFRELHSRLSGSGAVRLLLAEAQGRTLGGLIFFRAGGKLVSKFAASLPEGQSLRVYPALYGRTIEIALELGCSRLSWGTSAPSQEGLIAFKERWGAHTRPVIAYSLPVATAAPDLERYYDANGWPQRVWRHLPLWITQRLGGPLNRWFC